MTLPTAVAGSSYVSMWEKLQDAVINANGMDALTYSIQPLTGSFAPRLTNAEAISIIGAWRRAAARSSAATWEWEGLASVAFGQLKPTERYDMTKAHARDDYPVGFVGVLWAVTARLANLLDATSTTVKPLALEHSWSSYEAAARDAWTVQKTERDKGDRKCPVPGLPPEQWPNCRDLVDPILIDPTPILDAFRMPWWLWALIGYGAYRALGGDRR